MPRCASIAAARDFHLLKSADSLGAGGLRGIGRSYTSLRPAPNRSTIAAPAIRRVHMQPRARVPPSAGRLSSPISCGPNCASAVIPPLAVYGARNRRKRGRRFRGRSTDGRRPSGVGIPSVKNHPATELKVRATVRNHHPSLLVRRYRFRGARTRRRVARRAKDQFGGHPYQPLRPVLYSRFSFQGIRPRYGGR
jgi:hypothetical protein